MRIVKYKCELHNLVTTRQGMRKHLGESHARDNFKSLEKDEKGRGVWSREDFTW